MARKRDYKTDIKIELLKLGFIILSDDDEYVNTHTNLRFKCNYCDEEYLKTSKNALAYRNPGCRKCIQKYITGNKVSNTKLNKADFIDEIKQKYNYEISHVRNNIFEFKCEKCGCDVKRASDNIKSAKHPFKCEKCAKGHHSENHRVITKDEINKWFENEGYDTKCIHDGKIDGNKTRIKFKCGCGEIFERKWNTIRTAGFARCNKCSNSMSQYEYKIIKILNSLNIEFEKEKTFDECKNKNLLHFDFYLKDFNSIIEFDGRYHYIDVYNDNSLEEQIKRDKIKDEFCKKNNIRMLRIPYWDSDKLYDIICNFLYGNTEPSIGNVNEVPMKV